MVGVSLPRSFDKIPHEGTVTRHFRHIQYETSAVVFPQPLKELGHDRATKATAH